MGELTQAHHKAMARLGNGETILHRQLRLLSGQGITELVITTGPFADQLIAEAATVRGDLQVTWVPNEVYAQTNYIYSLHLAREYLDDDLLMLHGDLVFNRGVLSRLLADPRPDLGLVNADLPRPDKDFKARAVDGRIREVSVNIFDADCIAFQPLYKLSRRAVGVWLDRVANFVAAGNISVYAENALNAVADAAGIHAFSYAGDSVNEVDTLDDLVRVSAEIRLFDFAEQVVMDGPDEYRRIPELLRSVHAARPLLVGGHSFDASFLKPFLTDQGVDLVRFGDYSPNPKLSEVLEGLRLFRQRSCDAIISVGGGSALDVAKCIKLLAAGDGEEFPAFGVPLAVDHPHLAVPTTAGTGSESTHFAVVYIDGEKESVAHDAMLPQWVLLEPALLESLPDYHRKASALDALSQCVESIWAKGATDISRGYAVQGLRLLLDNLFAYLHRGPFDLEAARRMLRAANLGGRAINLTKTTAPHAMSYRLTSLYGTAHGHAAALCLAGVWRHYLVLAEAGDPAADPVLPALDEIAETFGSATRLAAAHKLLVILEFMQLGAPSVRELSDLDDLVDSVNQERLGNSPVPLSPSDLRRIYEDVLELRPSLDPDSPVRDPRDPDAPVGSAERYRNLQALHRYELGILREFDAFCERHRLRYYLSEGSILGAIRHGGPIPWDDDIDVMMPRAEYRRFVELALAGPLPVGLALDSYETNPRHWVFGAKLQLTQPTEFRLSQVSHVSLHSGPYIDIFPVDAVDRVDGPKFRAQALLLRVLRRMLFMSSGRSRGLRTNPLARIPLYLVTQVVPIRTVQHLAVWAQSRFNASPDATHWANLCSYYPIEREVFPAEWFGEGKRVEFEGLQIPVPSEAERMLEKIYGPNYAAIPSMAVRNTRSHAFAVDWSWPDAPVSADSPDNDPAADVTATPTERR